MILQYKDITVLTLAYKRLECLWRMDQKQKFLVRLGTDPNLDRDVAIQLPRMGFELQNISYDSTRKLNNTQKNFYVSDTDNTVNKTQYTPVPYNFDFILSIFVKNADDCTQIIEQIL